MRINNNLMAMNTARQLGMGNTNTAKSMEKLSSGLRINRAGDDAAGLAISEKMRGQIRGLGQASRNAQDGISLVQTAEGALQESQAILQRMRELAVQSANDTNAVTDRSAIQSEFDQLSQEIDRIGDTTEFNTKKLLNGGAGLTTNFSVETVAGAAQNWIDVIGGTSDTTANNIDVVITNAAKATSATDSATIGADATTTIGAQTLTINGYTVSFAGTAVSDTSGAAAVAAVNAVSEELGGITAAYDALTNAFTLTSSDVGSSAHITWSASAGALTAGAIVNDQAQGSDATITSGSLGAYTASGNTIKVISGTYEGLELKINSTVASSAGDNAATFKITGNGSLSLQIGANQGQDMSVSVGDMRTSALGIQSVDVSNSISAKNAITTVQNATDKVSAERAKLGAVQNRLEHSIKNLDTSAENLQAAESRVRDVDYAEAA